MSDMKCPFCQQELKCWDEPQNAIYSNWSCPNCRRFAYGNKLIWQELIHTRKELDVAIRGLDQMTWGCDGSDAEHLLKEIKQITAPEQKEELCSSSK